MFGVVPLVDLRLASVDFRHRPLTIGGAGRSRRLGITALLPSTTWVGYVSHTRDAALLSCQNGQVYVSLSFGTVLSLFISIRRWMLSVDTTALISRRGRLHHSGDTVLLQHCG